MNDLIDDGPQGNAPEFTVSELSGAIKRTIEGEFGHVRVRGELGRVSRPASGHIYLDLKDDRAVLAAVIWRGVASRLPVRPEEGLEVVATGRLTTFPGQSRYQLVIEDMVPAGAGALMAMLEARKKKLAAEGLFDPARKQPIPFLPEVVGVVTSPSGAVIRDILHRLRDRFPRRVVVWPVAVQGEKCAPEVTAAIRGFNALPDDGPVPRPDVIIVARGGGSVEDLWGFNEEAVVRAAAESAIPLISAVGHETDTTLIDHAADLRAPTPTAAAELAVPVRAELLSAIRALGERASRAALDGVARRRQRTGDLARALPRPDALVAVPAQRLDNASARLRPAITGRVQGGQVALARLAARLRPGAGVAAASDRLARASARLDPALRRGVERRADRLAALAPSVAPSRAARIVAALADRLNTSSQRLLRAGHARVAQLAERLDAVDRLRQTLGHRETLARGFAVVRGGGQVVTTAAAAGTHAALEVEFADDRVQVYTGGTPPSRRGPRETPDDQGSLF